MQEAVKDYIQGRAQRMFPEQIYHHDINHSPIHTSFQYEDRIPDGRGNRVPVCKRLSRITAKEAENAGQTLHSEEQLIVKTQSLT